MISPRLVRTDPERHGRRGGATLENRTVQFTAVFQKVPEGYIGFVEELPGANAQGESIEAVRAGLAEAVALVLEANRALAEESIQGQEVIREPLVMPAR